MRTIRLTVEYEGTDFAGWQAQADQNTVQGELEAALARIVQGAVRVRGASRTDAGVHARGQVAAFDVERDHIPLVGFERGLNTYLPDSIVVRDLRTVEPGWDPRRTSRGKYYRYGFWVGPVPSALERRFTWHLRGPLDRAEMERAARVLVGTHDFESFRATGCVAKHAVRTLYDVRLEPGPHRRLDLWVVGNAFVKNMVRIIAGTLVEVGQGKRTLRSVQELLEVGDRTQAGMTAPPHGLTLEEVIYDERLPPRPEGDRDVASESHNPA